jgi:signal transduction histidine kinase
MGGKLWRPRPLAIAVGIESRSIQRSTGLDLEVDVRLRCGRRLGAMRQRDVLIAIVLFALAALEVIVAGGTAAGLLLAAIFTLPVALRRRLPAAAVAGLVATPLVGHALGDPWDSMPISFAVALLIVEFSVAAYGAPATAVGGGLLAFAAAALGDVWLDQGQTELGVMAALAAGPWLAGWFARPLQREARELAALADRLEREREARTRLAVADERARLARELHDAVAHSVSAMMLQAAAAETVLTSSPADASSALRTVQELGRESIAELRRMLAILRTPGDAPAPEPVPERRRAPRRRPARYDLVLALACFAVAEWVALTEFVWTDSRLPGVLLMAAATLPLAIRRRFPLAVLAVATAAVALHQHLLDPVLVSPVAAIPGLIALYTVGAHSTPLRAAAGTAGAAVTFAVVDAAVWDEGLAWFLLVYTLIGGSFALSGHAVARHRRNAEELYTLTERLRREGDALARLAVVDERTRVARELHDTIANGVSVMVLQAGAAEQVLPAMPEQAREAAHAIQETGRSVHEELAALLGLLRTDEEDSPRAPQPGLEHLDALIGRMRQAGLPVVLRVDGQPAGLAPGVDASAYRVIQEALTNALKHGGDATEVTVSYEPAAIGLEVRSDGDPVDEGPPGHGLIGMRERVELYGGELRAGPEPGGGFAVRASLPLEERA